MTKNKIIAVIPARMNSTRYPGKPLLKIKGLPMIEHVRRRVLMCKGLDKVIVATCDKLIFDTVKYYGGKVIMTSKKHKMASDRVSEVAKKIKCTHVINVQGDELLVIPSELQKLVRKINIDPLNDYWNVIAPLNNKRELKDKDIVKCIISSSGKIIYCSRSLYEGLAYKNTKSVYVVLGVLAYTRKGIKEFNNLRRTNIEKSDSIDQMRIVENDKILKSCKFKYAYPGINTVAEEQKVIRILSKNSLQKKLLNKIINEN